jgi:hypothetical protein
MRLSSRHLLPLGLLLFAGCSDGTAQASSWHSKFGWDAAVVFQDPLVIDLCEAIERRDVVAVRKLIDQGADVNAVGKDNMTPLMWAFPEQNTAVLETLLRAGADPHVAVSSDLNTGQAIQSGDSVIVLAAKSAFDLLPMILQHGGDPDTKNGVGDPLLHIVISGAGSDRLRRVELLLDAGADIDAFDSGGVTPVMQAVTWGAQFELAMLLLRRGAAWSRYKKDSHLKLAHYVVQYEDSPMSPGQQARLLELLRALEAQGEDLDLARADVKRWNKELLTTSGKIFALRRRKEVEERKRREAEAAADAGDTDAAKDDK